MLLLTLLIALDNHAVATSDNSGKLIALSSDLRVDITHRSTKDTSETSAKGHKGSDDCCLHGADKYSAYWT